jgi:hypothetical protein
LCSRRFWNSNYVHSLEWAFSLRKYTTVVQAEVYVIKAWAMEYLDRNYKNRNIYILLDSQAAIKALDNYQINLKLLWDCHQSLLKLAKHNRVQLILVIEGNETTDQLAKLGAECPLIGSELALGISAEISKKAVRDWTKRPSKIMGALHMT